jgi:hypothetical protein
VTVCILTRHGCVLLRRFPDGRVAVRITSDGPGKDKELHVDESKVRRISPPSPPEPPADAAVTYKGKGKVTPAVDVPVGGNPARVPTSAEGDQPPLFPSSQHGWGHPINPASAPYAGGSGRRGGDGSPASLVEVAPVIRGRSGSAALLYGADSAVVALSSSLPNPTNTHGSAQPRTLRTAAGYSVPFDPNRQAGTGPVSLYQRQHTPTISPVIGASEPHPSARPHGHRHLWASGNAAQPGGLGVAPSSLGIGVPIGGAGQYTGEHGARSRGAMPSAAVGRPRDGTHPTGFGTDLAGSFEPSTPTAVATTPRPIGSGRRFATPLDVGSDGSDQLRAAANHAKKTRFTAHQDSGTQNFPNVGWGAHPDRTVNAAIHPPRAWGPPPSSTASGKNRLTLEVGGQIAVPETVSDPWAHTPASAQSTSFPST